MRFRHLEPGTIEEAASLLTEHNGQAKVFAGGTALLMQIREQAINPEYVVDIAGTSVYNRSKKEVRPYTKIETAYREEEGSRWLR